MTTLSDKVKATTAILESQGIYLSRSGHHYGGTGEFTLDTYFKRKFADNLFDLSAIENALTAIPKVYEKSPKWLLDDRPSNVLRHSLKDAGYLDYIAHGDFAMAMILLGFEYAFRSKAHIRRKNALNTYNCVFKCKIIITR